MDDALTQTGSVQGFTLLIQPHQPLRQGLTQPVPGSSWFYTFVDVPPGATNLTINATNLSTNPIHGPNHPLQLVVKFRVQTDADQRGQGDGGADQWPAVQCQRHRPGNSLSVGPTDVPPIQPGRYWIGIWNPNPNPQTVGLGAVILPVTPSSTAGLDFTPTNTTAILDDAVTYSDIWITNTLPVVSLNVGLFVQDPRISDLVFHLISPDGTRVLLMENRGGTDTNGAGASVLVTNVYRNRDDFRHQQLWERLSSGGIYQRPGGGRLDGGNQPSQSGQRSLERLPRQ